MLPRVFSFRRLALCAGLAALSMAGHCFAMSIIWDYTYDAQGFFTADKRQVLDQVSGYLEARMELNSAAIAPSGSNSWSWWMENPQTNEFISLTNPSTAAGQIVVYVGAQSMLYTTTSVGSPVALGGGGGSQAWIDLIASTNTAAAYKPYAGTISFNSTLGTWYFGTSADVPFGKTDFYSAAAHELGHLLGIAIGGNPGVLAWNARIDSPNKKYTGTNGTAIYGGAIPLAPDLLNFQAGLTYQGAGFLMTPNVTLGTRKNWTSPELAVLTDIGFVSIPEPGTLPLFVFAVGGVGGWLRGRRTRSS